MLSHLSRTLSKDHAVLQVAIMLDHDDPRQTLKYIGMDLETEELNGWLRGNSMYGHQEAPSGASVLPFRRLG